MSSSELLVSRQKCCCRAGVLLRVFLNPLRIHPLDLQTIRVLSVALNLVTWMLSAYQSVSNLFLASFLQVWLSVLSATHSHLLAKTSRIYHVQTVDYNMSIYYLTVVYMTGVMTQWQSEWKATAWKHQPKHDGANSTMLVFVRCCEYTRKMSGFPLTDSWYPLENLRLHFTSKESILCLCSTFPFHRCSAF